MEKADSQEKPQLFDAYPVEPWEIDVDPFGGREHVLHFKLKFGRELGEKLKYVTRIMDNGPRKGLKSHREYGHNRAFIQEHFTSEEERICSYLHLLGDFFQEIMRTIIVEVGNDFAEENIEPPFYEELGEGKWGWDVKEDVINRLIDESKQTFARALGSKNRI